MAADTTPSAQALQEELLRRARARASGRPGPGTPARRESAENGRAPLSRAQRRMWLLDRLGGAGDSYSVPFATRVRGELDPEALGTALGTLVERHGALRTRFGQEDGEPFQETLPAPGRIAPVVTACDAQEAPGLLAEEAGRPFDLAAGALPRLLVLRHGERDHTVLVTFHHITIDGGSLETVAAELAALYAAAAGGGDAGLPAGPPQYADHARREDSGLGGFEEGLRHWADRLAGAAPVPLPRPAGAASEGNVTLTRSLPPELPAALRELGTRHRCTPFTVALAAAFASLHRLTGADDLVIGVAGTHRRGSGMRGLVGLCVNTLPVRVDLSGDPAFGTLLDRVRDAQLTAQEHGEVPFDLVLERLGAAARGADGTALVRVTADVLGEPTALRLPGTTGEYVDVPAGAAKFDLSFGLLDTARPAALVQHAGSALDEETGTALAESHAALLAAVAADPSLPLSRLPAATPSGGREVHPAEAALRSHPGLADAAVVAPEGGPLLGYAVPRGVSGPPPAELRSFLRGRVPAAQVPAAVMLLDALPRTEDGSAVVSALPGLPAAPAPEGPRAEAVTGGFRELLGRTPGPDDDFFALGGHSLVAVQLAERLRAAVRLPLTGLDVLQARTPRAITALLDAREAERAAAKAASGTGRARRSREGTVLVTGATGGVGAFVVRELVARGRPVLALARPESAHLAGGEGVDVVEGDLADLDGLRAAVRDADAVVHAACTFTRHEVDRAAMEAMAGAWRRGPFVFVSSTDAYGRPQGAEVAEEDPSVEPLSPYGRAKRECEAMVLRAAGTGGRGGASAVRSPLVWGGHDRFREQLRWGATGSLYQAAAEGRPVAVPRAGAGGRPWYGAPWVHAAALARSVVSCLDAPVHGVANAVGGHVSWLDFATGLTGLLGAGGGVVETDEVPRDLDHPWRYRADRLAPELRPRPGEDWRTALAAMVAPAGR
ncbi:condensation domain-containing protein [Streptomyces sp. NPDC005805]|uniref:condensation domain-containing protein n=1 Tax=Streptomyces sp. NPDC005805 TaxID=3157068 RepID=UPI0033F2A262